MKICFSFVYSFIWTVCLTSSSESFSRSAAFCPAGYYKNPKYDGVENKEKFVKCSICPPGKGTKHSCTCTADTVCKPCNKGKTFSKRLRQDSYCQACQVCKPHQILKQNCTIDRDTVCEGCETGYYWDSFLKECKLCSWCFPDIFKKTRTLRVSDCMISEISEDFQCAKLIEPPYEQISWIEKQKTLQKEPISGELAISGSGVRSDDDDVISGDSSGDVISLLSDDEDNPLHSSRRKQAFGGKSEAEIVKKRKRNTNAKHRPKKRHLGNEKKRTLKTQMPKNHTVKTLEIKQSKNKDQLYNLLTILIGILGVICLGLAVALVFVYRKYSLAIKKMKNSFATLDSCD